MNHAIDNRQSAAQASNLGFEDLDRHSAFAAICDNALQLAETKSTENDALRAELVKLRNQLQQEPTAVAPVEAVDYERLANLVTDRMGSLSVRADPKFEKKIEGQMLFLAERFEKLQEAVTGLVQTTVEQPEMPDLSKLEQVVVSLENTAKGISKVTEQMASVTQNTEKQSEDLEQLRTDIMSQMVKLPEKETIDAQFAEHAELLSKIEGLAGRAADPTLQARDNRGIEIENTVREMSARLDMLMRHQSGIAQDVEGLLSRGNAVPDPNEAIFKDVEAWRDEMIAQATRAASPPNNNSGPVARNINVRSVAGT